MSHSILVVSQVVSTSHFNAKVRAFMAVTSAPPRGLRREWLQCHSHAGMLNVCTVTGHTYKGCTYSTVVVVEQYYSKSRSVSPAQVVQAHFLSVQVVRYICQL